MFEKEAVDRITQQYGTSGEYNTRTRIWQDGAEFGFQKGIKARINTTTISDCTVKDEWHYVKDGDFPKDEEYKWCVSRSGYPYVAKYEELFVSWRSQENKDVMCPYAWKEIVPPKEDE